MTDFINFHEKNKLVKIFILNVKTGPRKKSRDGTLFFRKYFSSPFLSRDLYIFSHDLLAND